MNSARTIAWYEGESRMLALEIADKIGVNSVDQIESAINSYLNLQHAAPQKCSCGHLWMAHSAGRNKCFECDDCIKFHAEGKA